MSEKEPSVTEAIAKSAVKMSDEAKKGQATLAAAIASIGEVPSLDELTPEKEKRGPAEVPDQVPASISDKVEVEAREAPSDEVEAPRPAGDSLLETTPSDEAVSAADLKVSVSSVVTEIADEIPAETPAVEEEVKSPMSLPEKVAAFDVPAPILEKAEDIAPKEMAAKTVGVTTAAVGAVSDKTGDAIDAVTQKVQALEIPGAPTDEVPEASGDDVIGDGAGTSVGAAKSVEDTVAKAVEKTTEGTKNALGNLTEKVKGVAATAGAAAGLAKSTEEDVMQVGTGEILASPTDEGFAVDAVVGGQVNTDAVDHMVSAEDVLKEEEVSAKNVIEVEAKGTVDTAAEAEKTTMEQEDGPAPDTAAVEEVTEEGKANAGATAVVEESIPAEELVGPVAVVDTMTTGEEPAPEQGDEEEPVAEPAVTNEMAVESELAAATEKPTIDDVVAPEEDGPAPDTAAVDEVTEEEKVNAGATAVVEESIPAEALVGPVAVVDTMTTGEEPAPEQGDEEEPVAEPAVTNEMAVESELAAATEKPTIDDVVAPEKEEEEITGEEIQDEAGEPTNADEMATKEETVVAIATDTAIAAKKEVEDAVEEVNDVAESANEVLPVNSVDSIDVIAPVSTMSKEMTDVQRIWSEGSKEKRPEAPEDEIQQDYAKEEEIGTPPPTPSPEKKSRDFAAEAAAQQEASTLCGCIVL